MKKLDFLSKIVFTAMFCIKNSLPQFLLCTGMEHKSFWLTEASVITPQHLRKMFNKFSRLSETIYKTVRPDYECSSAALASCCPEQAEGHLKQKNFHTVFIPTHKHGNYQLSTLPIKECRHHDAQRKT